MNGNKRRSTTTNSELKSKAKERVENKIGLATHFGIYLLVNVSLSGLNFAQTQDLSWSIYPAFFWGVGLFSHSLLVLFDDFFDNFKERMIDKEIVKLKKKK